MIDLVNKVCIGLLLILIRVYKLFMSPILMNRCRYLPTCSEYAIESLKVHGLLKGGKLTLKRILSCHPFGKSGIDMVPEKKL